MAVALKLLIERTEAALAAATDPKKKLRLERDLASFKLTAMRAESGDDGGDDEDEDDDDEATKHAKKAEANRRKSEALKHKARASEFRKKAAEAEDAAKKCLGEESEDDDEEAKALRAELHAASGSGGAIAALADQAAMSGEAMARLRKLEEDVALKDMRASINEAASTRRITKSQAKMLESKSPEFVRDYLAMHPKPLVNTDETELQQPTPRENADIDAKALADIDAIVAALPANLTPEQKAKVKQDMINGRRAVAANGAPTLGRY